MARRRPPRPRCQTRPLWRADWDYHLKMNTTRFWYLVAGGFLAASAALGASIAMAQPDNPAEPGNPADVGNPDVPNNPNDARCIAEPFVIQCQGGKYGQVPGAFS